MSRARTFADLATASEGDSLYSPNMINNGDMSVAQRGTSSTGQSSSGIKTMDQWTYIHSGGGTVDISQSTTVPTGFKNSYKIECNAADGSLGATEISGLRCYIEAQHCQKLLYGTSSAKTITLSFHVRSKQTGTYAVNVFSDDSSRHFTKTYTINSADTFEKKTITFVGDTSGAINDDNGKGIEFTWWLRAGSTYTGGSAMSGYEAFSNGDYAVGQAVDFLDDAANEFYLTGVQVEIGEVATPFKYETFAENLARCQRYYQVFASGDNVPITNASLYNTQFAFGFRPTYVPMRAAPTLVQVTGSNAYHFFNANTNDTFDDFVLDQSFSTGVNLMNQDTISGTQGDGGWFQSNSASGLVAVHSELS